MRFSIQVLPKIGKRADPRWRDDTSRFDYADTRGLEATASGSAVQMRA
jgi:hypothetical protein